jgi:hypothetical protein
MMESIIVTLVPDQPRGAHRAAPASGRHDKQTKERLMSENTALPPDLFVRCCRTERNTYHDHRCAFDYLQHES